MMKLTNIKHILSVSVCVLALSGCQKGPFSDYSQNNTTRYETAVESRQIITAENAQEAVSLYERLYARNSGDKKIAVKYAEALRKAGLLSQARTVLAPMAELKTSQDPNVLVEYASINIALGRFMHATNALDDFDKLSKRKQEELKPQAQNLRGVVLSASGQHEAAEELYREAMAEWKGDPSAIMNNLALCLVQQGYFDKAVDMMRQSTALSTSPAIQEQNIAFIEKLRAAVMSAPKSAPKATAPVDLKKKEDADKEAHSSLNIKPEKKPS